MIYLDHAAATPMSKKARAAAEPFLSEQFFNPSAAYLPALAVRRAYEEAKSTIAHVIGARGADLVITSGATESINLAFSLADPKGTVLISAVEHPAVIENAKRYKNHTVLAVDEHGRLDLEDFRAKLSKNTSFVSICLASSELGTLQPISEVAKLIQAERHRRAIAGEKMPLYFHCDASQGIGLVEVKLNRLAVDLLTLNAAKIYGPKGVGALYVDRRLHLHPQIVGGGQEMGLRSGTENVPATLAFAAAIAESEKHLSSERRRLLELKNQLQRDLSDLPRVKFLGKTKLQLPNFLPLCLPGLDAERLIFALEEQEVYLSTGAACAASKGEQSATLRAIGLSDEEIAGSLRISLGKLNNAKNLKTASAIIHTVVARELSRLEAPRTRA